VAFLFLHEAHMRIDLKVPFAEKDEAKALGAKWDAAKKIWYALNPADASLFARWLPAGAASSGAAGPASASSSRTAKPPAAASAKGFTVGSRFVEQPRVCDCLPWDSCAQCEQRGEQRGEQPG
jgi:hypothetical protein